MERSKAVVSLKMAAASTLVIGLQSLVQENGSPLGIVEGLMRSARGSSSGCTYVAS